MIVHGIHKINKYQQYDLGLSLKMENNPICEGFEKMIINHGTSMDLVVPNLQRARPKGQGTAGVQCQTWQEHGQLEGIAKHNGHAWRVAEWIKLSEICTGIFANMGSTILQQNDDRLVVSNPLKKISQLGWLFPILYMEKKRSKPPTRWVQLGELRLPKIPRILGVPHLHRCRTSWGRAARWWSPPRRPRHRLQRWSRPQDPRYFAEVKGLRCSWVM